MDKKESKLLKATAEGMVTLLRMAAIACDDRKQSQRARYLDNMVDLAREQADEIERILAPRDPSGDM